MSDFKIEPADRIKRLPPYLFGKLNALKLKKRQADIDVIDLGMGNPLDGAPQIVIDNELDEEFCVCDFEYGWMMTKWKPDLKGHSFYIRPSIGVGADRPTDYAVEIGYKIVGF